MAKPSRHSDSSNVPFRARTYFVTSKTAQGTSILQSDRMAGLFTDVLRRGTASGKFTVREFVVMRNHVHILLEVPAGETIERVVQLIKGNFSYRAKKELGLNGEIWQKGFSDVRITDHESYARHVQYIRENPVKAGYARSAEEYPHCSAYLRRQKRENAGDAAPRHD